MTSRQLRFVPGLADRVCFALGDCFDDKGVLFVFVFVGHRVAISSVFCDVTALVSFAFSDDGSVGVLFFGCWSVCGQQPKRQSRTFIAAGRRLTRRSVGTSAANFTRQLVLSLVKLLRRFVGWMSGACQSLVLGFLGPLAWKSGHLTT